MRRHPPYLVDLQTGLREARSEHRIGPGSGPKWHWVEWVEAVVRGGGHGAGGDEHGQYRVSAVHDLISKYGSPATEPPRHHRCRSVFAGVLDEAAQI
jgi:hypothetical protein